MDVSRSHSIYGGDSLESFVAMVEKPATVGVAEGVAEGGSVDGASGGSGSACPDGSVGGAVTADGGSACGSVAVASGGSVRGVGGLGPPSVGSGGVPGSGGHPGGEVGSACLLGALHEPVHSHVRCV
jgi:hypothetical protein